MNDKSRNRSGLAAGLGAALAVFAFSMLVLAVALRQDVLVALLPSVPLAVLIGGAFRMVVDDDWPKWRKTRDEAEAAREIRYHFAMFDQPAIDLGVSEVEDRTTDGELRVVYSHRAPRPRAGAR